MAAPAERDGPAVALPAMPLDERRRVVLRVGEHDQHVVPSLGQLREPDAQVVEWLLERIALCGGLPFQSL